MAPLLETSNGSCGGSGGRSRALDDSRVNGPLWGALPSGGRSLRRAWERCEGSSPQGVALLCCWSVEVPAAWIWVLSIL